MIELPVTSDAAQTFTTQLDTAKYTFDIVYNDRSGVWTVSLTNTATQVVIADAIPIVLGQGLLSAYNFGIGELFAVDTAGTGKDAGPDDFGDRVKLYWASEAEKVA